MQSPNKIACYNPHLGSAIDSQMTVSPDMGHKSSNILHQQKNYIPSIGVSKFDLNMGGPQEQNKLRNVSFSASKVNNH